MRNNFPSLITMLSGFYVSRFSAVGIICFALIPLISGAVNLTVHLAPLNCEQKPDVEYGLHFIPFSEEACCGNEKYRLGPGLEYFKFFEACNVEPKDEAMSLEDCYWTLYSCLVTKLMGSQELTQTSYNDFMAQNLSESKRSTIEFLTKDMKSSAMASSGNKDLQPLKDYFANYFNAEHQVCTGSSKDVSQEMWAPIEPCLKGPHPRIPVLQLTKKDLLNCLTLFEAKFPAKINTSFPFEIVPFVTCQFILGGKITKEEVKSANFDYEKLVANTLPRFYSKSLKEKILNDGLTHVRTEYLSVLKNGMSASISEIAVEISKDKQKLLGDIMNTENKNVYLNMLTIQHLHNEIATAVQVVCYGHVKYHD